jgi:lipopolysaccharide export system protein LptA
VFEADSIVINQKDNTLESFGNVHINDADSIQIYSQYLKYISKDKKAFLRDKVKLNDKKGTLTTNELEYDVNLKIGTYVKGGKLVNGKTVLTSNEGYYYGDTKDVYFKQKVVLIDTGSKIYTDTLLYNLTTEKTTFVCPTTIIQGKRIIKTRDGYYDLQKKSAILNKRSFIDDSTYTMTADSMAFDDKSGLGDFRGNAVYRSKDTVGGFDVIANSIKVNKKNNSFLATQKPILFIKQESDTIYVSADTLFASKISDLKKSKEVPWVRDSAYLKAMIEKNDSSSDRYFEAYYHVRIFSDSLQAVADSMFYSLQDSAFRLFRNPIAWAKENQITGDTIYLYTKNKKAERLYVFENAMSISKEGEGYFNQVKGNTINGLFKDGKMDSLRTKGSPAENIYYATDEKKRFIGVNKSTSDVIEVHFENGKAERVKLINNLTGTMYPMKQVDHKALRVKKFQWMDELRPKTKLDIFGY